jgi:hypothetical protein
MKKHNYTVYVGNIGCVYDGNSFEDAMKAYDEYCDQSDDNYGRAGGEPVELLEEGVPIRDNNKN